ncbi:hypothetical protein X801_05590 [Opisthorchis viverrini]|uniref:Uncharacterized protein n=1 Tax=Opisthorchis viverrini TaxID=6198 RepID=A0A1S8WWF6_OPIVI|nr:hypothetical protein X801_05590 [Opisthorchis viverrini]
MRNANRSNSTVDSPPVPQSKDTECTQVITGPIHTHKQSRPQAPKSKRKRSRSESKPAKKRKVSMSKRKEGAIGQHKAKKCKMIVKKVCSLVGKTRKPIRPKASSIRPRAIGKTKKGTKALSLKKSKVHSRKSGPEKKKRIIKESSVKSKKRGRRNVKRTVKRVKHPSGIKCTSDKVSRKRPRSVSRKPTAKISKKSTPKRCSSTHSVFRMISARVAPCVNKQKTKSNKFIANRGLSAEWAKRLRPRPLKSARFSCYRDACFSQLTEKPHPKKIKSAKSPKKKQSKKRRELPAVCGKNKNNMCGTSDSPVLNQNTVTCSLEQLCDHGELVNNHYSSRFSESAIPNTTNQVNESILDTSDSPVLNQNTVTCSLEQLCDHGELVNNHCSSRFSESAIPNTTNQVNESILDTSDILVESA